MTTQNRPIAELAHKMWPLVLIRGIMAVIFGIVALVWPGLTVWALVLVFGIYSIVDGITAISRAAADRSASGHRGWYALTGLFSVIVGIIAFAWPGITALALLYLIAFYAIVFGVLGIVGAFRLKEAGQGWIWLLVSSIVAIVFGILLIAFPGSGILSITWLVGWYALFFGALMIAASFQLRRGAPSA